MCEGLWFKVLAHKYEMVKDVHLIYLGLLIEFEE
jgi:hypothetical protein